MAYPLDRWLYSNQDPVNGYPPRVASPESVVDSATLGGKSSAFSSSSGSRYGSATDSSSRKSSTSTTPSTAPSLHLPGHIPVAPPPPLATTAFVAENYLPCEFVYAGCEVFYNLHDFESWLDHSLSHFRRADPPPKAICTICDCKNGIFEAAGDRVLNWRARMRHMADHFENGKTEDDTRPDFSTINYLRSLGLLSEEDYKLAMSISERPRITTLVQYNYQTTEMVVREQRLNPPIVYNPRDEDRQRQRERRHKTAKY